MLTEKALMKIIACVCVREQGKCNKNVEFLDKQETEMQKRLFKSVTYI